MYEMEVDDFSQSHSQDESFRGKAGILKTIQLKNFMCHDNFELQFNPFVNFIIGKNGSGKSAIQTGVAIGLGGKASFTNRGGSLKDLIKSDKNAAVISIVLANEGAFAFKPDEYGREIRVERHFSRSSSGYKIKSITGRVVTTEKKVLDTIVSHFNIQINNPICILHQDHSRNFLSTSDPKKKFAFFMSATRFADIDKLLKEGVEKTMCLKESHEAKNQAVEETFKDVKEIKNRLLVMEKAREEERKVVKLENELLWSRVNETKITLEECQKKRDAEVLAKEKIEKRLKDGDVKHFKEELGELKKKIKTIDDQVSEARDKVRPAQHEYSRKRELAANLGKELKELKTSLKRDREKLKSCSSQLEDINSNAARMKEEQEKMKEEMAKCGELLEELVPAEENVNLEQQQLQDTLEKHETALSTNNQRLRQLTFQKNKLNEQINSLSQNSSSNIAVYGQSITRIVDEIARRVREFKKKPIGPLGIHIKVKDSKWAAAIESHLGNGLLCAFCVDNNQDLQVLARIIKSVCPNSSQPSIFCSKFLPTKHDISQTVTGNHQYKSLAHMLDIEDPVVFNTLVDQSEIESILLIPTNEEAMGQLDKQHKVPRNCKKAFTLTGDLFNPAPNYKSYSNTKPLRAKFLQTNQQAVIRALKEEVAQVTQQINALSEEMDNIRQELQSTQQCRRKADDNLKQIKKRKQKIQMKMSELQNAIVDEVSNDNFLIQEAETLKEKIAVESEKLEEIEKSFEESKSEYEEAKRVFEELQNTISESDQEKAPIHGKIEQLKSMIEQASSKGDLLKEKLKEHCEKLSKVESEITELTEELTQSTEQASQCCEPVRTRRNAQDILRELKHLKQYLKTLEEENGGSYDDLLQEYNERRGDFDSVNKHLMVLSNLIERFRRTMKERRFKNRRLKNYMAQTAKTEFSSLLNEKQFDGKLDIDLEKETLEIKVIPMKEAKNLNMKQMDTASLSGGEKSFSTVCFIMALWIENHLPFHFLDEFDVFMDNVNRRLVMDILLEHAKQSKLQYVFLTPLDASAIKPAYNVNIHRLKSPRD